MSVVEKEHRGDHVHAELQLFLGATDLNKKVPERLGAGFVDGDECSLQLDDGSHSLP